MKTNPKALYSYVKNKQKVKTSISPSEKSDGSITASNQEVASKYSCSFIWNNF